MHVPDRTDIIWAAAHHPPSHFVMKRLMPRTYKPDGAQRPVAGKSIRRPRAAETTDAVKQPSLPLPHERDQTTRKKEHPVDPVIEQAKQDVDDGQQDTDLRGRAAEVFDRRWSGRRTRKP